MSKATKKAKAPEIDQDSSESQHKVERKRGEAYRTVQRAMLSSQVGAPETKAVPLKLEAAGSCRLFSTTRSF